MDRLAMARSVGAATSIKEVVRGSGAKLVPAH
jgi:hypothetical protein